MTDVENLEPVSSPTAEGPAGGPVCWLARVCDACGALADGPPEPACPRCGATRPTGSS
jgi:rubrerythrin